MKREDFKKFVEETLENVIQFAKEKTDRKLSRRVAFSWFFAKEKDRVTENISEYITARVYVDENNIYPCVDIGVNDILNDGTVLIWANVAGFSPRPFQKNWTDKDGPFVYIIFDNVINKLSNKSKSN
jgi:AAA+ ATPase superfamily predicted ATPase